VSQAAKKEWTEAEKRAIAEAAGDQIADLSLVAIDWAISRDMAREEGKPLAYVEASSAFEHQMRVIRHALEEIARKAIEVGDIDRGEGT
jgi:hypothetical protein